jgi:hypothetical protein
VEAKRKKDESESNEFSGEISVTNFPAKFQIDHIHSRKRPPLHSVHARTRHIFHVLPLPPRPGNWGLRKIMRERAMNGGGKCVTCFNCYTTIGCHSPKLKSAPKIARVTRLRKACL